MASPRKLGTYQSELEAIDAAFRQLDYGATVKTLISLAAKSPQDPIIREAISNDMEVLLLNVVKEQKADIAQRLTYEYETSNFITPKARRWVDELLLSTLRAELEKKNFVAASYWRERLPPRKLPSELELNEQAKTALTPEREMFFEHISKLMYGLRNLRSSDHGIAVGEMNSIRAAKVIERLRCLMSKSTVRVTLLLPDTVDEALDQSFNGSRYRFTSVRDPEEIGPNSYDILFTNHHWFGTTPERFAATKRAVANNPDGVAAVNLTDSHHWYEKNLELATVTDLVFPGHEVNTTYLENANALVLGTLPLTTYQWSRSDAISYFNENQDIKRCDALYGGFRFYYGMDRNTLIKNCMEEIQPNALYLRGHSVDKSNDVYYSLSAEGRFQDWMRHKVCLQLPIFHDVTARLFDSLLTGQVPIIPHDLAAMDHIISPDIQRALPILKFPEPTPAAINRAFHFALELYDREGVEGARRRHEYCLENHMLISTVQMAISGIENLVPDVTWI